MRNGERDRRIQLRRVSRAAPDSNGTQTETWTTYATVWARKIEIDAREFFAAATTQAESTVRWEIRWRSDVSATDRLTFDGVDFEMTAPPAEIGRREGLTLFSRAIKP